MEFLHNRLRKDAISMHPNLFGSSFFVKAVKVDSVKTTKLVEAEGTALTDVRVKKLWQVLIGVLESTEIIYLFI